MNRRSAPPALVVLVRSKLDRTSIRSATRSVTSVVYCNTARELLDAVHPRSAPVIVTDVRDAEGTSLREPLKRFATYEPRPIVLLQVSLDVTELNEALGILGVFPVRHLVRRGAPELGPLLCQVIETTKAQGAGAEIQRAILPHIPRRLKAFFTFCAFEATRPISVVEVTESMGVVRRTLESHLERAGLFTPQEVIAWCRLLHAGWRLSVSGQPIKRVVHELDFPSVPSFYYQLKHYTGYTPTELVEAGGFPLLLQQFAEQLEAREPNLESDSELAEDAMLERRSA